MMQKSENNRRQRRYAAILLAYCMAMPIAAQAREIDDDMPTPGLYRIDIEGTTTPAFPGNTISSQMRTDGSTGDETVRHHVNGYASNDIVTKGNGPHTQCVGLRTPTVPQMPGCISQPGTRTKDGIVIKAKCASVESTTVIRKIDSITWEYVTSMTLFQPSLGDMSGMRPMLEQQAKNAPTAKEREKAANALAELSDRQRNMPQKQAEMMDSMAKMERSARTPEEAAMIRASRDRMSGKTPMQSNVSKMRWTRISNICDATP